MHLKKEIHLMYFVFWYIFNVLYFVFKMHRLYLLCIIKIRFGAKYFKRRLKLNGI